MKVKALILMVAVVLGSGVPPAAANEGSAPALAPIQLSPERRQLIGVTFATVERREVAKQIDTTGNIEPDEQLQSFVQTRFSGWIQQVFANQSYQFVRRGQPLFTVYSPDLASTEQEFLLALDARDRVAGSSVEGVSSGAKSLSDAAAERLALLGIPQSEIERLKRERKARNVLTIYSPASGYIVERNALPNMYVQPDARLYAITDFSKVWVYAAVFQDEIALIKVGDPAVLAIDAYPGDSFPGRVDFVWPQIDMATRTARVRMAFENPNGKLKPGMYGRITLQSRMGERTVIPAGGVLRTGTRNIVFVDRGDGYLTPIDVELGPRAGNELVVLNGLRPGQRIVASANFLIDSESQLQAATGAFVPPPPGVSANSVQPSQTAMNQPSATLELVTVPNPPARGRVQVRATLRDSAGKAIDGAKVSVAFNMAAMPAMGMSAMRESADLIDQGGGAYQGELNLESGGTWQVTASATKDGQTLAQRRFNLTATGGM